MTEWQEVEAEVKAKFQLYRKLRDIMNEAKLKEYPNKHWLLPHIRKLDVTQASLVLKEIRLLYITEKYKL